MKNLLILTSFIVLTLSPWACNRQYPLAPAPNLTPTFSPTFTATATASPTPNLTPVCGFTIYNLGTVQLTGTLLPTGTPITLSSSTTISGTPTQVSFIPSTKVIQNLASWQLFSSAAPPVDFASQMLIVFFSPGVCPTSVLSVTNVCEGPTQINISATNTQVCPVCFASVDYVFATGIAVSQSNLPIVWNITQVPCE